MSGGGGDADSGGPGDPNFGGPGISSNLTSELSSQASTTGNSSGGFGTVNANIGNANLDLAPDAMNALGQGIADIGFPDASPATGISLGVPNSSGDSNFTGFNPGGRALDDGGMLSLDIAPAAATSQQSNELASITGPLGVPDTSVPDANQTQIDNAKAIDSFIASLPDPGKKGAGSANDVSSLASPFGPAVGPTGQTPDALSLGAELNSNAAQVQNQTTFCHNFNPFSPIYGTITSRTNSSIYFSFNGN